jgi:hypothetical protein
MSRIIRLWPAVTALLGLALAIYLIIDAGAEDVAHAMLVVGWGLCPITLFHVVPLFFSALSWRALLPGSCRLDVLNAMWMRWVRESINTLLPSAGVGGDVVRARLAHLWGVPKTQAAASMVVNVTVGVATQLLFAAIGVVLLLSHSTEPTVLRVAWAVLGGIGMLSLATAAFLAAQHRGMLSVSTKLAGGLLGFHRVSRIAGSASAVDDAVVRLYRDRAALSRQSHAPCRLGERYRRDLVGDAVLGATDSGSPSLHPRKPGCRYSRRGFHGPRPVGHPRKQFRPVRSVVRNAPGERPHYLAFQKGARVGLGRAGPLRLATGRRAPPAARQQDWISRSPSAVPSIPTER